VLWRKATAEHFLKAKGRRQEKKGGSVERRRGESDVKVAEEVRKITRVFVDTLERARKKKGEE